ncbi:hypothetical protein HKX48_009367, partial [Thoreauomyces humboldtii]
SDSEDDNDLDAAAANKNFQELLEAVPNAVEWKRLWSQYWFEAAEVEVRIRTHETIVDSRMLRLKVNDATYKASAETSSSDGGVAEQIKRNVTVGSIEPGLRKADVTAEERATLFPDSIPPPAEGSEVVPWSFDQETWDHLHNDVHVLTRSMEAYHRRAEDMHRTIPYPLF